MLPQARPICSQDRHQDSGGRRVAGQFGEERDYRRRHQRQREHAPCAQRLEKGGDVNGGAGLSSGIEVTPYPNSRQYLFSLNVNF